MTTPKEELDKKLSEIREKEQLEELARDAENRLATEKLHPPPETHEEKRKMAMNLAFGSKSVSKGSDPKPDSSPPPPVPPTTKSKTEIIGRAIVDFSANDCNVTFQGPITPRHLQILRLRLVREYHIFNRERKKALKAGESK